MNIQDLLRQNIKQLKAYSSARDEFSGEAMVFLDANENPYNEPYNRYPDPLQTDLKVDISALKACSIEQIFLGNGSDEAIDLLFRAFCNPGVDNVLSISPTYGMYQVAADINNVEVRTVQLDVNFQLSADKMLAATDEHTKLLFLCSPNNPTGNLLDAEEIKKVLDAFQGLVVLDEAYIDFAAEASFLPHLAQYPNLVILQTFSKAWGMAGLRLGMAFASEEIISVLNKIKYPYNINVLTQIKAKEILQSKERHEQWVNQLLDERKKLAASLATLPFVQHIYPSDSNFLLVKMHDSTGIYNYLLEEGVVVRNRSKVLLCAGCLRITVGSPYENLVLMEKLNELN
ncbi:MAG: histidinol-phosphate transaminase [Mangrovibacterium sp.]